MDTTKQHNDTCDAVGPVKRNASLACKTKSHATQTISIERKVRNAYTQTMRHTKTPPHSPSSPGYSKRSEIREKEYDKSNKVLKDICRKLKYDAESQMGEFSPLPSEDFLPWDEGVMSFREFCMKEMESIGIDCLERDDLYYLFSDDVCRRILHKISCYDHKYFILRRFLCRLRNIIIRLRELEMSSFQVSRMFDEKVKGTMTMLDSVVETFFVASHAVRLNSQVGESIEINVFNEWFEDACQLFDSCRFANISEDLICNKITEFEELSFEMSPQMGIFSMLSSSSSGPNTVESIAENLAKIGSLAEVGESGKTKIEDVLGDALSHVDGLRDSLTDLREDAGQRLDGIAGGFEKVFSLGKEALYWVSFGAFLYGISELSRRYDREYMAYFLLGLFGLAFSARFLIGTIIDIVITLFGTTIRPQGPSVEHVSTFCTSLVMALFAYHGVTKPPSSSGLIKFIMSFDRMSGNLTEMVSWGIKLLEKVYNIIGVNLFGKKRLDFLLTGDAEVDELMKTVKDLMSQHEVGKLPVTPENYYRMKQLDDMGEELLKKIPRDKTYSNLAGVLSSLLRSLKAVIKEFASTNFSFEGLRQEPVVVMFRGGPGASKSNSLEHFNHAICAATLSKEEFELFKRYPHKFVHNRQSESEYWEGYHEGQHITYFDDFGQCRDVAGNPDNEYMNMIRAANEFPYALHMADISKKGNSHFNSKFIFGTTNMQDFVPESIISREALYRRFDFVFDVCPRKEFCTEESKETSIWDKKIDSSKLPLGILDVTSLQPEITEYHEYSFKHKGYTGKIYDFDEVVDLVISRYLLKAKWFSQKKLELDARREKWRKARVEKSYEAQMGLFDSIRRDLKDVSAPTIMFSDRVEATCTVIKNSPPGHYKHMYFDILESLVKFNYHPDAEDSTQNIKVYLSEMFSRYGDEFLAKLETGTSSKMIKDEDPVMFTDDAMTVCFETLEKEFTLFERAVEYSRQHCAQGGARVTDIITKIKSLRSYITKKNSLIGVCLLITGFLVPLIMKFFKLKKSDESLGNLKDKCSDGMMSQMATAFDPNAHAVLDKICSSNSYELWLPKWSNGEWKELKAGYMTFLKGRIALVPRHFLLYIQEMEKIKHDIIYQECHAVLKDKFGNIQELVFSVAELVQGFETTESMEKNDLVLIKMPSRFRNHSDILKFFPSIQEIRDTKIGTARLTCPGPDEVRKMYVQAQLCDSGRFITPKVGNKYKVELLYEYQAPTVEGDCGGLFSVLDKSRKPVIYGIHVAGCKVLGYGSSSATPREWLEECLEKFDEGSKISQEFEIESQLGFMADAKPLEKKIGNGQFVPLWELKKGPSSGNKSSIVPSKVYGRFGPVLDAPAKLRPFKDGDMEIDPYDMAINKYCLNHKVLNHKIVKYSGASLNHFMTKTVKKHMTRTFTFEEAILGLEGEVDFKSLNRKSSSGFPHVLVSRPGFRGKQWFFGKEEEFDLDSPQVGELRESVEDTIVKAKEGVRQLHVFVDCLKDETRPLDRVKAGKTRLFSSGPLELLILYRMYFGAFKVSYDKCRIKNGSAIGVNPFSTEWSTIARTLCKFGAKDEEAFGAGDYSSYDGTEVKEVFEEILRVINNWYDDGPENKRIREVLWLELTNSIHIYRNSMYMWPNSLPSGHPMTSLVNNLYNQIAFRYCWIRANGDNVKSIYTFDENVFLITLGDDNLFSVSKPFRKLFNEISICPLMDELGLIYTTEMKGEAVQPLRRLDQVSFLKRKFKFDRRHNRYLAPLDMKSVIGTLNWTRNQSDMHQITIDKFNNSVIELALHGREVFEEWVPRMNREMKDAFKCELNIIDYEIALETSLSHELFF